jgi:hypothetical protein
MNTDKLRTDRGKNRETLSLISVHLFRCFGISGFKVFALKPYLCLSVFICGLKVFRGASQIALPQVPQKRPPGTLTVPHWQQ